MNDKLRALTVYQPWGTLIMIGAKPYEFRSWNFAEPRYVHAPTFRHLIGRRIVIHASIRPIDLNEIRGLIRKLEHKTYDPPDHTGLIREKALPLLDRICTSYKGQGVVEIGAGLGTVRLGVPKSARELFPEAFVNDSDRMEHANYGWPMEDPKPWTPPVPAKGAQSFWYWKNEVPHV